MKHITAEHEGRLTIALSEEARKGDEVEELVWELGAIEVNPVGEAYTQMDGTCPCLFYSFLSGLVYMIDLNADCEKLMSGETVTIEGREPSEDEKELIRIDQELYRL